MGVIFPSAWMYQHRGNPVHTHLQVYHNRLVLVSPRKTYKMSLLKSLANSLEEEKEVEEKKQRQLATNPASVSFTSNLPIIKSVVPESSATKELIDFCHNFEDIQNKETNVQANMSSWFMHEHNSEFMKLCDYAVHLGTENSPSKVDSDAV